MKKEKTAIFIGHRNINERKSEIREELKKVIEELIEQGVEEFLCGGMGSFDIMAAECVREVKKKYPNVECTLVIPYMNYKKCDKELFDKIMAYVGIESAFAKFAIPKRNRFMVERSAYAICYVKHIGGAWKTYEYAKKSGLRIIDIDKSEDPT